MSKPQVTITLGRSGQVVKKAGNRLNNSHFDTLPLSGSKRSIKERLGVNADNFLHGSQHNIKRQRGGREIHSLNAAQDLRVKLMKRSKMRQANGPIEEKGRIDPNGNISRAIHTPEGTYMLHHVPKPKVNGPLRRIPLTRSAEDLLQLNSMRKSYSSWAHERLRHESPDRLFRNSRGHSPPRQMNGQRQMLVYRPTDTPRLSPFVARDVYNHAVARPQSSSPFAPRTSFPLDAAGSLPQLHPPGSISEKSIHLRQEPLTIGRFLHSLGLAKYAIHFQAEEVDMAVLKRMGDNDLKEMGIPLGPRRKILFALLSRARHA